MITNITTKLKKSLSELPYLTYQTLKSLVKLAVLTKRTGITHRAEPGSRIIILGNGPSLSTTIADYSSTTLANTPSWR